MRGVRTADDAPAMPSNLGELWEVSIRLRSLIGTTVQVGGHLLVLEHGGKSAMVRFATMVRDGDRAITLYATSCPVSLMMSAVLRSADTFCATNHD